jgi:hypothetical protein
LEPCGKRNDLSIFSFFIIFFFWTNEPHILQAFWQHQACQLPNLY